jgi:peptidoglycan hydrolase-like protein with peptidoglycan-binding domain
MPLQSKLFKGDRTLESCLVQDIAHVRSGASGSHVAKIQHALARVDNLSNATSETGSGTYGATTAAAVLAFKKKRNIIYRSYETQVDDIVGKMTIAALDREMLAKEGPGPAGPSHEDVIAAAFQASRSSLRNVVFILDRLVSDLKRADRLNGTMKPTALQIDQRGRVRGIVNPSRWGHAFALDVPEPRRCPT